MPTEQPTAGRAGVFSSSRPMPGPRTMAPLHEVSMIGKNQFTLNKQTMHSAMALYLNRTVFSNDVPEVWVTSIEKTSNGDFEIEYEPMLESEEQ
jgi:hypothetical protein